MSGIGSVVSQLVTGDISPQQAEVQLRMMQEKATGRTPYRWALIFSLIGLLFILAFGKIVSSCSLEEARINSCNNCETYVNNVTYMCIKKKN